ncbi:MAG: RNA polymerase sigma-54 factor, partial [Pseudomonadota bacterium]|nr:RNA polymerase sigma-54 factor [Pseudomonadota bacterium]
RDWEEMAKRPMSDADRQFLASNVQSARWLARATQQRAVTMLRVAQAMVDRQSDFLRHGQRALKPMVLREIADTLELHESTISRTVANKLIDTPAGLFALKDLFSAALMGGTLVQNGTEGGAENTGASAAGVKARIRALIDDETPDRVISDDMIVEALRGEGIGVARRTVAKYRESLNIPSSVIRRRVNRIHGLIK